MNGLVTNAVDLSALRAPGASIRDALLPTEQLTLTFGAGDWTIEAYTQFSESHVEIDPKVHSLEVMLLEQVQQVY